MDKRVKIDLGSIQRVKRMDDAAVVPEPTQIAAPPPQEALQKVVEKEAEKKMDETGRSRLILILRLYVVEFPDKLDDWRNMNFDKLTDDELLDVRKQMDEILSSKSSLRQTQALIKSGIQMVEFAICYATPIKCQGLAVGILNDEEAMDDIKHVALKNMSMVNVQPELRLAYKMVSSIMMLHNMNSALEANKEVPKNEKLESINQEFSDI